MLYRAYLLGSDDSIIGFQLMECGDDKAALVEAATIKSSCAAVEVWEAARIVGRTTPDDAPSRLWWRREGKLDPEILVEVLDVVGAYAIFDAKDRLVACNQRYLALHAHPDVAITLGVTWIELARAGLKAQTIPEAVGREEQWLALRCARRGHYTAIRRVADQSCYQVEEQRLASGGIVCTWIRLLTPNPGCLKPPGLCVAA